MDEVINFFFQKVWTTGEFWLKTPI